jgi:hypothetical protein
MTGGRLPAGGAKVATSAPPRGRAQRGVGGQPRVEQVGHQHLNLGEDHRKLGDVAGARRHLDLGREAAASLGGTPTGR